MRASTTAGRITSVTFRGSPKSPSVLIRGRNLGSKPAPYPPTSPSGQSLCGVTIKGNVGLDYGTNLYLVDLDGRWAAGRYRPRLLELDCIGLIVTRFTQTEVAYRFGAAYAQVHANYSLAQGDAVRVGVNGASVTVRVRYGATITT